MKKYTKTQDGKKGGLFVGKSHAKGGIPAIVVDTGQPIEVEGGEVIINKEASKKYWKELSEINQSAGNGVPIPPPMEFSADVERYKDGGKVTMSAVRQGTEIEMEHAKTIAEFKKQGISLKEVARKIAKDHLKENPNYYKIISKLKLAKGGEIVCRSCGNSWLKHQKDVGINVFECDSCGSQNSKFYKEGGNINSDKIYLVGKPEVHIIGRFNKKKYVYKTAKIKSDGNIVYGQINFSWQGSAPKGETQYGTIISTKDFNEIIKKYKQGGSTESLSLPEKEKIYEQWKELVNMSKPELQKFYNSVEGKQAGLTDSEAKELGIDNGRTSARWIMKMKDVPFVNWTDDMWRWAKKQINFIKRMSGNKGSLYNEKGTKTRKHTSLLIWGHNPEKFNTGGTVYAKGSKIPSKNKGGDCYYVAGTIAMSEKLPKLAKEFQIPKFQGTPYVVHAEVSGQGAISGLRYGHAWVEDDLYVYDFSNGREIVFPKQLYYSMGNVITTKPKYYKYTFKEAVEKMLETGHYGSWELKTQSGL